MLYIGIDLGTSACKLLLVDEKGCVRNTVSKEYPLCFPHPGWSEQDPGIGGRRAGRACRSCWPALTRGRCAAWAWAARCTALLRWMKLDRAAPAILVERRPYRRRNSLAERYGWAPGAQRAHGKHRVCRLYSAQAALDEKA